MKNKLISFILVSVLIFTLLIQAGASSTASSWYIKRNGNGTPTFSKDSKTVDNCNGYYIDINSIPDKTLIIIPGLAFDERGNRLGKGKGYYDKFLAELLSTSEKEKILAVVGYCYDFQIIDKVITEPNDIPVDYIISDKRIVKSKVNNK